MPQSAEAAFREARTRTRAFERALERSDRELRSLRGALRKVGSELGAVEQQVLDLAHRISELRREANALRQKVKKHYKLLRETDPGLAPARRRSLARDLTRLRARLEKVEAEIEELEARYEESAAREAELIGREVALEREVDAARARHEALLKEALRLADSLGRRVRDLKARL